MNALFLATICSATIALVFKYSESHGLHRYAMTSTNYLTATVVSLAMLLANPQSLDYRSALSAFAGEIGSVLVHNSGPFSAPASIVWTVLLGLFTGCLYFVSFIYFQQSVGKNGAGLSSAFSKLGILLPMLLSLLLWRELPGPWQWVGILLAISSIALVYLPVDQPNANKFQGQLLLLFCFSGASEFTNKLFQKYTLANYRNLYLLLVFGAALLISLRFTWREQHRPTGRDVLAGLAVGIPNLFSSYFLIAALGSLPASVVYPIYSAGSILLINLVSVLLFKERLSGRQLSSIGLTMVALAMINL